MFGISDIGIWDLFVICCLGFVIFFRVRSVEYYPIKTNYD